MRPKPLYLNNEFVGSVASWGSAAMLLSAVLRREISDAEAMRRGSEGPDGFYVNLARIELVFDRDRTA